MQDVIAITNRRLCDRPFLEQIDRVCKLCPAAVILREKDLNEAEYAALAADVYPVCKKLIRPSVPFPFPPMSAFVLFFTLKR
jgi:thiamine-phosphate pyrophosphorylase